MRWTTTLTQKGSQGQDVGCGCWKRTATNKALGLKIHIRRKKHHWRKRRTHLANRTKIHQDRQAGIHTGQTSEDEMGRQRRWQLSTIPLRQVDLPYRWWHNVRHPHPSKGTSPPTHLISKTLSEAKAQDLRFYGFEGCLLDETDFRYINGANAHMLSHITDKTKRDETTAKTTTFNIIAWILSRRPETTMGGTHNVHDKNDNGEECQIKETLKVIFNNRQEVDILKDVSEPSWDELKKALTDRQRQMERTSSNIEEDNGPDDQGNSENADSHHHTPCPQATIRFFTKTKNQRVKKRKKWTPTRQGLHTTKNAWLMIAPAIALEEEENFFLNHHRSSSSPPPPPNPQWYALPTWEVTAETVFLTSSKQLQRQQFISRVPDSKAHTEPVTAIPTRTSSPNVVFSGKIDTGVNAYPTDTNPI